MVSNLLTFVNSNVEWSKSIKIQIKESFSDYFICTLKMTKTGHLICLGGPTDSQSIGPQSYVIEFGDNRLMIDCGLAMGQKGKTYAPDLGPIMYRSLNGVLTTHGHLDHIGYIPALTKKNPLLKDGSRIYGTIITNEITKMMLVDALKNDTPYFGFMDVMRTLNRFEAISPLNQFEPAPGFKVTAIPVGHVPGAVSFLIELPSGKKGLILGDASFVDQLIVKGALPLSDWRDEWIPDELWGIDLTNTEETEQLSFNESIESLVGAVRADLSEGRNVFIMAFANGKAQNAALALSQAGIECWLDGMTQEVYKIFRDNKKNDNDIEFPEIGDPSGIRFVNDVGRSNLLSRSGPKVIITTGGMGDRGPIVQYMQAFLPEESASFYATSWLAHGSIASKLLKIVNKYPAEGENRNKRQIRITDERNGESTNVPIRAKVQKIGLTGHCRFSELKDFISRLCARRGRIVDNIVLTHGSIHSMRKAVVDLRPFTQNIIFGLPGTIVDI